jgi:hypothetical protein
VKAVVNGFAEVCETLGPKAVVKAVVNGFAEVGDGGFGFIGRSATEN